MLIRAKDVTVYYGKAIGVQNISLEVAEGSVVCLLGANGSGKSTMLKALSGLVPLASGEIWFLGRKIDQIEPHNRVKYGLVQVPEGRRLFSYLTVLSNLKLGAALRKDKADVKKDLDEIFEHFPVLWERRNQKAGTLSGGEQQMLAIGRALMAKPKLLLMDEPSLGLAPMLVNELVPVIKNINQAGIGVLLAEQNIPLAFQVAHTACILETGRMVLSGSVEEVKDNEIIKRAYLGG